MAVFHHTQFDRHEQIVYCHDVDTQLQAIIAIHSTRLGPALGGCRLYPYATEAAALTDALRLSRGMSYKAALTGLPLGGGKSVIIADPSQKSPALFRALGDFIESLGGRYIVAEDLGTSLKDLCHVAETTRHVVGVADKHDQAGLWRSGDPSPSTAQGVFNGIRAAVAARYGRSALSGLKVAIQGVGSVGFRIARLLHEAGAQLWVSDAREVVVRRAVSELNATAVPGDEIFDLDVDLFCPCALGAVINDDTLPRLKVDIIAGCANNQLEQPHHGDALQRRGILYAPDYVINAGGLIDVALERNGYDHGKLQQGLEQIYHTLTTIFEQSQSRGLAPHRIADQLAEERLTAPKRIEQVA